MFTINAKIKSKKKQSQITYLWHLKEEPLEHRHTRTRINTKKMKHQVLDLEMTQRKIRSIFIYLELWIFVLYVSDVNDPEWPWAGIKIQAINEGNILKTELVTKHPSSFTEEVPIFILPLLYRGCHYFFYVKYKRKHLHEVLVNRLVKLA